MRDRNYSLPSLWLLVCVLLLLSGCASYSHSFKPIDKKLAVNDPDSALKLLEKEGYSSRNELLYLLNKAMLLRMQGDYAASNQFFEQAKDIIRTYSAASVLDESAAFIINDSTRAYTGIPLEQVMVHVYEAMNYLEMNDLDAARVEALQVDLRLKQLTQNSPESALSADPYARYLSGMIFEDLGEYSDAMIAYRKAYEAYQEHAGLYSLVIPDYLKMDLLRMSRYMGLDDEYKAFKAEFGVSDAEVIEHDSTNGEVVLLFSKGLAPVKREQNLPVISPSTGILVRLSLPYYKDQPSPVSVAQLSTGAYSSRAEVVEDVNGIARATLQAYMPAITARALARAMVKYQMAQQTGKQNDLAVALVMIVNIVTERADTRSWLTLPAQIQMARLSLPAGTYNLNINLLDPFGRITAAQRIADFEVKPGKRRYISYHYTAH